MEHTGSRTGAHDALLVIQECFSLVCYVIAPLPLLCPVIPCFTSCSFPGRQRRERLIMSFGYAPSSSPLSPCASFFPGARFGQEEVNPWLFPSPLCRRTDCEEPVKLVDHPEYRTPQLRTKWSSLIGRLCFLCLILVVVVCGCVVSVSPSYTTQQR